MAESDRIRLEPFRRDDIRTLAQWLADPKLRLMTAPDWEYPVLPEFIEREYFVNHGDALILRASIEGRMVGHLGLRVINRSVGHLFHLIVAPPLHGKGFGRAMIDEVVRMGFLEFALHRLQLSVFEENVTAIARYLRAGFQIEGRHRDAYRYQDHSLSTYSMALLRREWDGGAESI